jgi:hypothetical protein
MTTKITYKKALAGLKKLDPDFVYPAIDGCKYVKDNKPSCGVGQIANKEFGIAVEDLAKWDSGEAGVQNVVERLSYPDDVELDEDEGADLRDQDVKFTMKAEMLLQKFQVEQDTGTSWGRATEIAERHVREHYGR